MMESLQATLPLRTASKKTHRITIDKLKALGVKTTMLSGDKSTVVKFVAESWGLIMPLEIYCQKTK